MNPNGGNITIDRSTVNARSNTDIGKSAVFAGDDGVIHAEIILSNAEIVVPDGAAAVDVNIDQEDVRCQAISSGPAVTLITNWNDAANRVEIQAVIRSSKGGMAPSTPVVPDEEPVDEKSSETDSKKVTLYIGRTNYTVGDDSATMDVAPFVENGRTFVPVRFIAEAFEAVQTVSSDVAPFVRNGRTWLPLRAIGEILGAQFDWGPKDGAIRWVSIIR